MSTFRKTRYWFSVISLILLTYLNSPAQNLPRTETNDPNALPVNAKSALSPDRPFQTSILFTGKLMGYFRLPNRQVATVDQAANRKPCQYDYSPEQAKKATTEVDPVIGPSLDAKVFLDSLPNDRPEVLVGMGDNFAPNYFSRVFYNPGSDQLSQKELNSWNGMQWIRYDNPQANTAEALTGNETIPTDNVACFLARAGYDAIVPGKHDFYYGPQRLRALARFLASIPSDPNDPRYKKDFHPVQMLAANLMIKTSWVKDHEAIPDSGKPKLGFRTEFGLPNAPHLLEIVDFTDGGFAFPWTQFVRVTATGWDLQTVQDHLKISLCEAKEDPDEFLTKDGSCLGHELEFHKKPYNYKKADGTEVVNLVYKLPRDLDGSKNSHYAICAYGLHNDSEEPDKGPYCLRFTMYQPYFYSPRAGGTGPHGQHYLNPKPYLLKNDHVVIFGVVDPKLGEHIGGDNFAWEDVRLGPHDSVADPRIEKRYTTQLAVGDPVQAIIQINDLFEHEYAATHSRTFRGVRLLLAQMPADQAKQLAEHLPRCLRFDAVIAAADDVLATPNETVIIPPANQLQDHPRGACEGNGSAQDSVEPESANGALEKPPAIVFVPPTHERSPLKPDRAVQVRELSLSTDSTNSWKYELSGKPELVELPGITPGKSVADFWKRVCDAVDGKNNLDCHPLPTTKREKQDLIQQLALWAMYKYQGADVSLLQQRDVYVDAVEEYLADHCATATANPCTLDVQEVLDRILWKGDYIQPRLVQGSILKAIDKQSKTYKKADKSAYLPVEETGRALVTLGMVPDSKSSGDFLINSKPIDDNELYTVATSDYIALGDTGYADLAKPPVGDPPVPARPKHELVPISTAACMQMKEFHRTISCKGTIKDPKRYYDQMANQHLDDPRPGNTVGHQLYAWSFLQPHLGQDDAKVNPSEKKVQHQPNWNLSLDQFSIGFTALTHNGSEQTLSNRFAGVQEGNVNSAHAHEIDWDANSSFRRFHPHYDIFVTEKLQYYSSHTAQNPPPAVETQSKNMLSLDGGAYWHLLHLKTGKELPQLSVVSSAHYETQVGNPLTTVNLKPAPPTSLSSKLIFPQGRTHLAVARAGVRFEDRKSFVEGGLQGGENLNAVQGFRFSPSLPTTLTCLLQASQTLSDCVNNFNQQNPTTPVISSTKPEVLRSRQPRYGAYWKIDLTVPLYPPVLSYNFKDTSDYFFLSGGDNSADTRFRHQLVHSLKFKVFPSLSFEPTYTLFLFQNKVDYHDLFQQQYSVKINYSFDCSNWHDCWHQSQYKKPSQ